MHPAGHAMSEKQSQAQSRTPSRGQDDSVLAELLVMCNQILTARTQPDFRRFF
jgi:hypothetical protein